MTIFAIAMAFDSFDMFLYPFGYTMATPDNTTMAPIGIPEWRIIFDLDQLLNSLEEILEFAAAIFFLMVTASAYGLKSFGFGDIGSMGSKRQ